MFTNLSFARLTGRSAALGLLIAGMVPCVRAQSVAPSASAPVFLAATSAKLDLSSVHGAMYSTSSPSVSSSSDGIAEEESSLNASAFRADQPPPRRRYGRPNYSDSHTNPDGSSKFAFIAGAGMSVPTQDTSNYLTSSYAFQVGAGRNFSKVVGILFQFDYDHFGFQGKTLQNQQNLYNTGVSPTSQYYLTGLDGSSHVWSFTLNPTLTIMSGEKYGAYAVGTVGFYHKTANFTVPTTGTYCDPYYGCYQYAANQSIDKYTSNAPGFGGGLGMTYKPSRFSGERFYLEAKYIFVDNSPRAASFTNYYPPNANQTYYIPVTFGLRF